MKRQQKAVLQPRVLAELRREAGMPDGANPRTWSKELLQDPERLAQLGLPAPSEQWPKNEPFFRIIGNKFPRFRWTPKEFEECVGGVTKIRRAVVLDGVPTVRGVGGYPHHPTLADLLLLEPKELAANDSGMSANPAFEHRCVGSHEMQVSTKEERVPPKVVALLHAALDKVATRTSSLLVRLDMAPLTEVVPLGSLPVYEIEMAPGLALALSLNGKLLRQATTLFDAVVLIPEHHSFMKAYEEFVRVGVPVYPSWDAVPPDVTRVYASCSGRDVPETFRQRLITDPWTTKEIDFPLSGGRFASRHDSHNQLCEEFPDGFVLKPLSGWGASDVLVYSPHDRKHSHTKTRIDETIAQLGWSASHVVQPFYPPQTDAQLGTLIWRVFAMRESHRESFRLIGGLWNARLSRSLIVHGARDAVFGPLAV